MAATGTAMQSDHQDSPELLEFMAMMRAAQEAERTRVARRLHDEVSQALVAFRMKCYALESQSPQLADRMQAVMPLLDEAISVVRELSEDLKPGLLRFAFESAIEWQAERFQAQTDIACAVDVDVDDDRDSLDLSRATELFRIFQDALATIGLHPGTTSIDVKLWREGKYIRLEIRDDGRPPGAAESIEHALGVLTMTERARRAGGAFTMTGSRIEVRLPLNE
jgi:signal transduction histidine kinase